MKKSILNLFDSKKINSTETIFGGLAGSKNSTTQVDTGATSNGTYDKETDAKGGGCDSSNTGFVGTTNGQKDNPNEIISPSLTSELSFSAIRVSL